MQGPGPWSTRLQPAGELTLGQEQLEDLLFQSLRNGSLASLGDGIGPRRGDGLTPTRWVQYSSMKRSASKAVASERVELPAAPLAIVVAHEASPDPRGVVLHAARLVGHDAPGMGLEASEQSPCGESFGATSGQLVPWYQRLKSIDAHAFAGRLGADRARGKARQPGCPPVEAVARRRLCSSAYGRLDGRRRYVDLPRNRPLSGYLVPHLGWKNYGAGTTLSLTPASS